MKVLLISHMYPSSFNSIEGIFVHQQVKELQRQGCEVKVISPVPITPFPIKYFSKKWKKYSQIPEKAIWDGIEVYYPRYLDFPKALFFASSGERMFRGIKKIVNKIHRDFKFDLIHAHVALPDGYAGMLLAKESKKPLIVTIHGADFQRTILKNKKCKENIEKVINFSNKTIVVSNKLKKTGEKELKIEPEKILIIPDGINQDEIFKRESNLLRKYENKKIILSVSHLIKTKGIDLNLRAIAKLKDKYQDLIYLIIGEGRKKKSLEKLTRDLNLEENVEFLGQLPHTKVMEYISICDIFSLPSWKEGFGVVYIEAMAHKKPVIACRKEGPEDFIKNKETGLLVKPKDVDNLVEAIDYLLSNSESAKEIGERARKLVLENYIWEKIVGQLIKVYRRP